MGQLQEHSESRHLQRRAFWMRQLHQWHWISSALCLIGLLLFALTGITLNHARQIEATPLTTHRKLVLPAPLRSAIASEDERKAMLPASVAAWPDGTTWRVGIERPDAAVGAVSGADERVRTVPLDECAIATSGDYRHVFEDHGQCYSHHIDPRSGYPVPHEVASVSVMADDCMQADPLGTTHSVVGVERGMAYAREHDLAVLMIVRTAQGFEQRLSPAFARNGNP